MIEIFQYDFMQRAVLGSIVVASIAPVIGIFLILRRYSLLSDVVSHTALAGMALAVILGIHPLFGAIGFSLLSSIIIERLREKRKISGDATLALLLSGSLALTIALLSFSGEGTARLSSFLFGSILTVTWNDILIILISALLGGILLLAFGRKFIFISFDSDAAKISGLRVEYFNVIFIIIASLIVGASIPITGALLIGALMIIPSLAALQIATSFKNAFGLAVGISLFSALSGLIISFYSSIPPSAAIVFVAITLFTLSLIFHKNNS